MSSKASGYEKTQEIFSQFTDVSNKLEDIISQMKSEYQTNPETLKQVLKAESDFAEVRKEADTEFKSALEQAKEFDKQEDSKKEGAENDN